jgi:hypothetical protein
MMPRAKLLDAQAAGVTGTGFRLGLTPPPYTLRTEGGFTGDTVSVQTAPTADGEYIEDFGMLGGPGEADARVAPLALNDEGFGIIEHKVHYIRGVTGASLTGTATLWLETVI